MKQMSEICKDMPWCDEIAIEATFRNSNGSTTKIKLSSPEDFLNDIVPIGCLIGLVFTNGIILKVRFNGIEDDDGELVLYAIRDNESGSCFCMHYNKLLGYFYCNDRETIL